MENRKTVSQVRLSDQSETEKADLSLPCIRSEAILALDASFINPTCPSYLPQTAQEGGYAAQLREDDKLEKYSALCTQHHIDFEPLALEVYGRTTARGMNTLKDLVRYAVTHSNAEMPQTVINWQFHQLKARLCVTLLGQKLRRHDSPLLQLSQQSSRRPSRPSRAPRTRARLP